MIFNSLYVSSLVPWFFINFYMQLCKWLCLYLFMAFLDLPTRWAFIIFFLKDYICLIICFPLINPCVVQNNLRALCLNPLVSEWYTNFLVRNFIIIHLYFLTNLPSIIFYFILLLLLFLAVDSRCANFLSPAIVLAVL